MNYFKAILITLSIIFFNTGCKQSDPIEAQYTLVWSDDFNGTELDENKWDIQLGDGSDYGLWQWGNNEAQYYKAENIEVNGGFLKIKAMAENFAGYDYTSARIRSIGSGDFKYGRIEASIRMSDVQGLWHAFWLLPSNPSESWPESGEIDIMEYVGKKPDEILNTVHFADQFSNHQYISDPEYFIQNNEFHKYIVEWNENIITWYIDDLETFKVTRTNNLISSTWPFDAEFHLLLNTAVGGNLGGSVDANALQNPQYMEVDYVRVYQR